jgi:hypothetical protein
MSSVIRLRVVAPELSVGYTYFAVVRRTKRLMKLRIRVSKFSGSIDLNK